MKKKIIIFGIIGFLISFLYFFMGVLLDISETIGYCEDCNFTPFWNHITFEQITHISLSGLIGGLVGGLIGYTIHRLFKNNKVS